MGLLSVFTEVLSKCWDVIAVECRISGALYFPNVNLLLTLHFRMLCRMYRSRLCMASCHHFLLTYSWTLSSCLQFTILWLLGILLSYRFLLHWRKHRSAWPESRTAPDATCITTLEIQCGWQPSIYRWRLGPGSWQPSGQDHLRSWRRLDRWLTGWGFLKTGAFTGYSTSASWRASLERLR